MENDVIKEQILTQGYSDEYEKEYIKKDGSLLPVTLRVWLIHDDGGAPTGMWGIVRDITGRKKTEEERERLITELQDALAKVKTLSGFLPICTSCKKIRDDQGYWNQIETYIHENSEAAFTHNICPECKEKFYPPLDKS